MGHPTTIHSRGHASTLADIGKGHLSSSVLHAFPRVDAELIARRGLQRRRDTKFLLQAKELEGILGELTGVYGAALAGASILAEYRTQYFDTPHLQCFHDHRRGRRPRSKVRLRHYPDRGLTYLEVKTKRGEFLTTKERLPLEFGSEGLNDSHRSFVSRQCDLPVAELTACVWTNFLRLTLVGLETAERITADLDLEFVGDQQVKLPGVAILEVKQFPYLGHSPIMKALRARRIRPVSASKYCTATALTSHGVRLNRLMPALRTLEGACQ